jgi:hypothetical protein
VLGLRHALASSAQALAALARAAARMRKPHDCFSQAITPGVGDNGFTFGATQAITAS